MTMIIRDPLIHATYFYLRENPDDTGARRAERHDVFVSEVRRMTQTLAGWLALSIPDDIQLHEWPGAAPVQPQPLMPPQTMQGRTNASAVLRAYALRNMLLLRVIVARGGEHEPPVWEMLDEALGPVPTAESWLHTARYWCGGAPRPPEDLERTRTQPVQAPFGVLCLGHGDLSHVLTYPDARTEQRANTFLNTFAPRLEWYPVQAHYLTHTYANYVTGVTYRQQQALDRVAHSAQTWSVPTQGNIMRPLAPLHEQLDDLETLYQDVIGDLTRTQHTVRDLRALAVNYRLELMQSGLWGAAPTVWQAEVATLAALEDQIAADVQHIETTLRRIEFMLHTMQARLAVQQGEHTRVVAYGAALAVLAMLLVLIADANLLSVAIRLGVIIILAVGAWFGWRFWQQRTPRHSAEAEPKR